MALGVKNLIVFCFHIFSGEMITHFLVSVNVCIHLLLEENARMMSPKGCRSMLQHKWEQHFPCSSASTIQWNGFCNGSLRLFQQCCCTQRRCTAQVRSTASLELHHGCLQPWVACWALSSVNDFRISLLPSQGCTCAHPIEWPLLGSWQTLFLPVLSGFRCSYCCSKCQHTMLVLHLCTTTATHLWL